MQNQIISNVRSMESDHKPLVILRCKCVVVGDACVGKTALTQVFNSGGSTYPKNYIMVRCLIAGLNVVLRLCRPLVQNFVSNKSQFQIQMQLLSCTSLIVPDSPFSIKWR